MSLHVASSRHGISLLVFNLIYYINMQRTTFWWFSEDSQTLCEDFQRSSKSCAKARQSFLNILCKPQKIAQDFQRSPNISEEEWMMFRSYRNTSKYFLRDYVTIAMVIFSLLKIACYLHVRRYHVYMWELTWYFTGIYIVN